MPPFVVGLVGGIASGKSSVARLFQAQRPMLHLDADAIARKVSARAAVRKALASRIPAAVDPKTGCVDREKLARLVFSDPETLAALEEITHPPIRRAIIDGIKRAGADWVLLDAALLQESGADALCDAVVYVACPARVRRRRAIRDRGWSGAEHRAREARQWSCRRKRARATHVVDNGSSPERARRDVSRVLGEIEKLASRRSAERSRKNC